MKKSRRARARSDETLPRIVAGNGGSDPSIMWGTDDKDKTVVFANTLIDPDKWNILRPSLRAADEPGVAQGNGSSPKGYVGPYDETKPASSR